MNSPDPVRPYLHLLPLAPGELPGSWLHRIAARSEIGFRAFSERFLDDKVRNSAGFDAYLRTKTYPRMEVERFLEGRAG